MGGGLRQAVLCPALDRRPRQRRARDGPRHHLLAAHDPPRSQNLKSALTPTLIHPECAMAHPGPKSKEYPHGKIAPELEQQLWRIAEEFTGRSYERNPLEESLPSPLKLTPTSPCNSPLRSYLWAFRRWSTLALRWMPSFGKASSEPLAAPAALAKGRATIMTSTRSSVANWCVPRRRS